MSRCSVGLLSLFRRVVVAPMLSLFVVVVRCSVFGVLLFFPRSCSIASELPGLYSSRSAQYETAMPTEGWSAIYTISDGRGLGLQCRRR